MLNVSWKLILEKTSTQGLKNPIPALIIVSRQGN